MPGKSPLFKMLQAALGKALNNNPELVPNRRQFIKSTLPMAGVGLLPLSWLASCAQSKTQKKDTKIAIIGAGLAGLNCAWQLQQLGFASSIYEAQSQPGGRVQTLHDWISPNVSSELGGEFIDTSHRDMLDLASSFGLSLIDLRLDPLFAESNTYLIDGRIYQDTDLYNQVLGFAAKVKADFQHINRAGNSSFYSLLDHMPLSEYVDQLACDDWMKKLIKIGYTTEFGLDAEEQSALNFLYMAGQPAVTHFSLFADSDERYKIKGGNDQLIQAMLQRLTCEIKTNSPLVAIRPIGQQYRLIFSQTQEVTADFVVITAPFSALREVDLNFQTFGQAKRRCIQDLGYGMNNKLLLKFQEPVWRHGAAACSGYAFSQDIGNGWDHTQMQNGKTSFGGYTVFKGGSDSLAFARDMRLPEKTNGVVNAQVRAVDALYPNAASVFSQQYKKALWSRQEYIQGSYACFKPGQYLSMSERISAPEGRIFFAGEHCSNTSAGYMNGAVETGRLVAEQIYRLLS